MIQDVQGQACGEQVSAVDIAPDVVLEPVLSWENY